LADEFEVSLFGPGFGESVVVHTGDGRWLIVDSCEDSRRGTTAPLAYLQSLNQDPADCVDWAIATHAHDDHIAGFAKVVRECSRAEVVLPTAAEAMQFLALDEIDYDLSFYDTRWSVYEEYRQVFKELERRSRFVHYAGAGTVLPLGANPPNLQLKFVAPSGHAVTQANRIFGRLLRAAINSPTRRVASRDPNVFSLGLIVSKGDFEVLLGGDVRKGTQKWGWKFAHVRYSQPRTVSVHKIPHHGSKNAYVEDIWRDWLTEGCVNLVAPFRSSRLPREEMLTKMKRHGLPIWATARGETPSASHTARQASAQARDVAPRVIDQDDRMGQLRYRKRPGQPYTLEKFGPAVRVP
jgi:beta-lactamase superfamily II metal-dependent hydrolase